MTSLTWDAMAQKFPWLSNVLDGIRTNSPLEAKYYSKLLFTPYCVAAVPSINCKIPLCMSLNKSHLGFWLMVMLKCYWCYWPVMACS
jgi:hypothetical protein